jgi:hypothetical protein
MFLLAGVAALAIAMPVSAEKGGKGGGHGNDGPHAEQAKGKGHGNHGSGRGRGAKPGKSEHHAAQARGRGNERRQARRDDVRVERGLRARADRIEDRRDRGRNFDRGRSFDDRSALRFRDYSPRFVGFDRSCPPGLAKKNNGCLPPGQAKKRFGLGDRFQPDWFSAALPAAYRDFYPDTSASYYRYDSDGYVYRVDSGSNLVSGLIPLLGGGFAVGQLMPAGYDVYNLPVQYRDVYRDSDDSLYRYGDNAIYEVDPQSGMIESIVALLTGDLSVGESLPTGYDAYNLPLDYRDDYVDNDDHLYRYADGNIYQVDTKTQIIQAIVEMLV